MADTWSAWGGGARVARSAARRGALASACYRFSSAVSAASHPPGGVARPRPNFSWCSLHASAHAASAASAFASAAADDYARAAAFCALAACIPARVPPDGYTTNVVTTNEASEIIDLVYYLFRVIQSALPIKRLLAGGCDELHRTSSVPTELKPIFNPFFCLGERLGTAHFAFQDRQSASFPNSKKFLNLDP